MSRKRPGRTALVVLAALLAIGACIVFVIVPDLQVVSEEQRYAELLETYGESLMEACTSGLGEQGVAGTLHSQVPMRMLILEAGGEFVHDWHNEQPNELYPTTADEVDWIVCVDDRLITVESCRYSQGGTVDRVLRVYSITALNPQTQSILGQLQLPGSDPLECPEFLREEDFNSFNDIEGGVPDYETFSKIVFG